LVSDRNDGTTEDDLWKKRKWKITTHPVFVQRTDESTPPRRGFLETERTRDSFWFPAGITELQRGRVLWDYYFDII